MATKKKAAHKRRLLSSTRPKKAVDSCSSTTPSSQASRALIRKYHTLEKQLAQATSTHDEARAASIQAEIEHLGGLSSYQRASIAGQSLDRGGDTSKLLVKWLGSATAAAVLKSPARGLLKESDSHKLRLLEIGALSPDNACAKSGLFEMERIDLQSQHPSIEQQDFMERPIPSSEEVLLAEGFDIISLSLVLNFVPDATTRGAMLKRVTSFLRPSYGYLERQTGEKALFPSLFLVLPAPCVLNSRYLDEKRLEAIMESVGYSLVKSQMSNKLTSSLWRYNRDRDPGPMIFKKEEVRPGGGRNNFAITLR